jgi:hypothetical protein
LSKESRAQTGGIDICTDDVTIVADLYRKRGYRVWKRYVGESPIFPHKAVGSASLLIFVAATAWYARNEAPWQLF